MKTWTESLWQSIEVPKNLKETTTEWFMKIPKCKEDVYFKGNYNQLEIYGKLEI